MLKFSGEGDVGFTRSHVPGTLNFKNGGSTRLFDNAANSPQLQHVYLSTMLNAASFGGVLDVVLGPDADVIAPFETNTRPGGGPRNKGWDVTQAYLTHKCPETGGWISVGKFTELSGLEHIKSSEDFNYSRSILFGFATPFTETGVRAGWTANSKVDVILGETLGWDQIKQTSLLGAATNLRTSEAGIVYHPSSAFMWKVNANIGKEQATIPPTLSPVNGLPLNGVRRLYDTAVSGTVTKNLTLAGQYDYATQDNVVLVNNVGAPTAVGQARWQGGAAYANYQFTSKWAGSLRGELFRDNGGYRTGFDQKWGEQTATIQYQPSSPLFLRLEYRNDDSNQAVFARTGTAGVKFQHTLGAEAVIKY
jgi:hypothetical protein